LNDAITTSLGVVTGGDLQEEKASTVLLLLLPFGNSAGGHTSKFLQGGGMPLATGFAPHGMFQFTPCAAEQNVRVCYETADR